MAADPVHVRSRTKHLSDGQMLRYAGSPGAAVLMKKNQVTAIDGRVRRALVPLDGPDARRDVAERALGEP